MQGPGFGPPVHRFDRRSVRAAQHRRHGRSVEVRDLVINEKLKFLVDDEVAYFNTAAMSPVLRSAHAAAIEAVDRRSKPWTLHAADWFPNVEELRNRLASVINASSDDVALVPST